MKNIMLLLMVGLLWSCGQKDYVVRSATNEAATLDEYETFAFASNVNGPNLRYTLNDDLLKATIKDAVNYELSEAGYERDPGNPDLLVNFRVLEEATTITVNQDDYWGSSSIADEGLEEIEVEAGTLIVDVASVETGEIIWTGFASGILDGDEFDRSESAINMAVQEIFDQFSIDAEALSSM